jgi:hypothetical protein
VRLAIVRDFEMREVVVRENGGLEPGYPRPPLSIDDVDVPFQFVAAAYREGSELRSTKPVKEYSSS